MDDPRDSYVHHLERIYSETAEYARHLERVVAEKDDVIQSLQITPENLRRLATNRLRRAVRRDN